MTTRSFPGQQPELFAAAVQDLSRARLRSEVTLTEVPAPQRIAPHAVAMTADVGNPDGDELASGRFVLLYDPSSPEPWDGSWRAVTFARAEMEPELATDPMLGDVGWSWLVDCLDAHDGSYAAEAGTVTRVVSQSYAGLADRESTVEMEIRASWTIHDEAHVSRHLLAWADLLCTMAGLPPLPEGVVALPGQRR